MDDDCCSNQTRRGLLYRSIKADQLGLRIRRIGPYPFLPHSVPSFFSWYRRCVCVIHHLVILPQQILTVHVLFYFPVSLLKSNMSNTAIRPVRCPYCLFRTLYCSKMDDHKTCHWILSESMSRGQHVCSLCSFSSNELCKLQDHIHLDHHRDGHVNCPCRDCCCGPIVPNSSRNEVKTYRKTMVFSFN